jgi:hypothetical protein
MSSLLDTTLFIVEIILLIWIVWQGEKIRFYEREVWRMHRERHEQQMKWREAKRAAILKKLESQAQDPLQVEPSVQQN